MRLTDIRGEIWLREPVNHRVLNVLHAFETRGNWDDEDPDDTSQWQVLKNTPNKIFSFMRYEPHEKRLMINAVGWNEPTPVRLLAWIWWYTLSWTLEASPDLARDKPSPVIKTDWGFAWRGTKVHVISPLEAMREAVRSRR